LDAYHIARKPYENSIYKKSILEVPVSNQPVLFPAFPILTYARLLIFRFIKDEKGQDFAEYALIFGTIGVVAIAVLIRYRTELISSFNSGIAALQASR
jgi:Flp pilus assembly pilin Flp